MSGRGEFSEGAMQSGASSHGHEFARGAMKSGASSHGHELAEEAMDSGASSHEREFAEGAMESGANCNGNEQVTIMQRSWFSQFRNGSNPWMARYVYGLIFLIANLLAWAVRDYGHLAFTKIIKIKNNENRLNCSGAEGVLRVSLGCFLFFLVMFLSTVSNSKLKSKRDRWHSGWWSAKLFMWFTLTATAFVMPSSIILLYGKIAQFGSGVFLFIQLISIISFIIWLNQYFQYEKIAGKCHIHVMLLAAFAYVISFVGVILMFIWYASDSFCLLNIFFIAWTLFLIQLMTNVSLHPKVNAGLLTPGLMALYVVFVCWCAIRSEPAGEKCGRKVDASEKTDWLTIISFIVALLTIVIATFSTGIDSDCFQFRKAENQDEDAVPYGYGFFHCVFATGAMYFAMLLIGWNTHLPMKKWTIDVGWTSTWVRIVNEWLAVSVYIWMLVAPIVLKSRQTGASSPT